MISQRWLWLQQLHGQFGVAEMRCIMGVRRNRAVNWCSGLLAISRSIMQQLSDRPQFQRFK